MKQYIYYVYLTSHSLLPWVLVKLGYRVEEQRKREGGAERAKKGHFQRPTWKRKLSSLGTEIGVQLECGQGKRLVIK